MKRLKNSLGFTLIELLIVIVIIGILAGVLIAIIDPTRQQNRAQDANIQSVINKVVLATQGYVSAYGSAPDEAQFSGGLQAATFTPRAGDCGVAGTFDCQFSVDGTTLPITCVAPGWNGNGSGASAVQCFFRYFRDTTWTADRFRIYAKSAGLTGRTFVYDTTVGTIRNCDSGVALDTYDVSGASCAN